MYKQVHKKRRLTFLLMSLLLFFLLDKPVGAKCDLKSVVDDVKAEVVPAEDENAKSAARRKIMRKCGGRVEGDCRLRDVITMVEEGKTEQDIRAKCKPPQRSPRPE